MINHIICGQKDKRSGKGIDYNSHFTNKKKKKRERAVSIEDLETL